MSQVKVEARGLTKRYGDVTAVDGVSLSVHAGEIVGIVGPNGAGKTTTIEMMAGLRKPDAGACTICGFDPFKDHRAVRNRIGLSLQQAGMPPDVTVRELLALYASFYESPAAVGDLLNQFQLTSKAKARTETLSGGQRQRLALALALIGRPEVVFLDEPTTGLDPQSRRGLWSIIRSLKERGRAIILSSHYMDEVEQLCDRVLVINRGRVLACGAPRALIAKYGPESVIELELSIVDVDAAALAALDAVTGIKVAENRVMLYTSNTATSLMALAMYAQRTGLSLDDLRTRSATMDDVFIALAEGRGPRGAATARSNA